MDGLGVRAISEAETPRLRHMKSLLEPQRADTEVSSCDRPCGGFHMLLAYPNITPSPSLRLCTRQSSLAEASREARAALAQSAELARGDDLGIPIRLIRESPRWSASYGHCMLKEKLFRTRTWPGFRGSVVGVANQRSSRAIQGIE